MQKRLLTVVSVVGAALLCTAGTASAQSIEDRLRTQLRQTALDLRQAQDAQAQLQADKTAAEQQRDKALADLKQAQAELAASKGKSGAQAAAEHSLAAEKAGRAQDDQQLAKYKSGYEDLLTLSRSRDAERTQLQAAVKGQQTKLETCEAKNVKLYQVGHDILDAYEHVDLGTFAKSREPFAQSTRVRYDMIAQDYGDKLYAGKYDPNALAPAASAPQAASASAAAK